MRSTSKIAAALAALMSLVFSPTAGAQDDQGTGTEAVEEIVLESEEAAEAGDGDEDEDEEDDGRLLVTPFVAPSFSPELGFGLYGGALLSWRTDRDDPDLSRSVVPISVGGSTTGSIQGSVYFFSYWMANFLRFNTTLLGGRVPDNYWGVGYTAGSTVPKGEQTTAYVRLYWSVQPELLIRVVNGLYGGIMLDWNHTIANDVNPRMANDEWFQATGSENFNSGVGAQVMFDSRDNPGSPYSGLYMFSKATFYVRWLGGQNTFWKLQNQYRHYVTLGRPGSTLAWVLSTCNTFGSPPWSSLCQLGSVDDLRGYFAGQYRDETAVYAIVEYRIMMERAQLLGMRQGFAFFAGAGSVGQYYRDLTNWLPNGGFGYRLELQPRMNGRIDFGFGNEGMSLYVTFLEAF